LLSTIEAVSTAFPFVSVITPDSLLTVWAIMLGQRMKVNKEIQTNFWNQLILLTIPYQDIKTLIFLT